MKIFKSNYLILLAGLLTSGAVTAADDDPVRTAIQDFIANRAELAAGQRVSVSVSQIDPRLKLSSCRDRMQLALTSEPVRRNTTVKVVCNRPTARQIYVPARVSWEQSVLVASVPLAPGQAVNRDNSDVAWVDSAQLRGGTFSSLEQIDGARVKRRIQQGQPISDYNICLICKGDNVTIIAKSAGLEIKTSGEALEDGNAGDSLRLRNISSRKSVVATVVNAELVEVNF